MNGFTLVDGGVALVIVISAILAYSRGFVREAMSIAGWIAAAILAFLFAPKAMPLIEQIPYLDKIIGESCQLAIVVAFAAVFAVALVVVSLFTPLFSSVIQRSALGGADQVLGFLFGALRGVILVAVALIVYTRVIGGQPAEMVAKSRSFTVFLRSEETLNRSLPTDVPGWILARYDELVGVCDN